MGLLAQESSTRGCLDLVSEAGEQSVPSHLKAPRMTPRSAEGGAAACISPSLPRSRRPVVPFYGESSFGKRAQEERPIGGADCLTLGLSPPSGGSVGLLAARLLLPVLLHSELAIGVLSKPH